MNTMTMTRQPRKLPTTTPTTSGDAPDLTSYDTIVVAFSGGKDSLACLLHLLDSGVDRARIELWHHDIDGREGSTLMDWPVTRSYCDAVAAAFGVPIYYSWLEGGFEREMARNGTPKARTWWQQPDGTLSHSGGQGRPNTRGRFPQVSADLSVRWCSSYLKIDVCAAALRGQARFTGARTLVVTGERAEESTARARYKRFEPHHAASGKRHIDAWRPIHAWSERQVWQVIERHRVRPHPAYVAGWGRTSCMFCVFGSKDQWASARTLDAARFAAVAERERASGSTIQRKRSIVELADAGTSYPATLTASAKAATSHSYDQVVILGPDETWTAPPGAYGESCGPT